MLRYTVLQKVQTAVAAGSLAASAVVLVSGHRILILNMPSRPKPTSKYSVFTIHLSISILLHVLFIFYLQFHVVYSVCAVTSSWRTLRHATNPPKTTLLGHATSAHCTNTYSYMFIGLDRERKESTKKRMHFIQTHTYSHAEYSVLCMRPFNEPKRMEESSDGSRIRYTKFP